MGSRVVCRAVGGEQLERREPDAVEPRRGPAVPAVGGGERVGVDLPPTGPLQQLADVEAGRRRGGQPGHRRRQRRPRRGTDSGVLVPQQLPGLRAPRQQLGID